MSKSLSPWEGGTVCHFITRDRTEKKGFFIIGPLSEDAEEELRKAQLHTEDV